MKAKRVAILTMVGVFNFLFAYEGAALLHDHANVQAVGVAGLCIWVALTVSIGFALRNISEPGEPEPPAHWSRQAWDDHRKRKQF